MPESGRHVPSAARALIQEAKRRGPRGARDLVDEARRLEDPYFVASTLLFLSDNPTVAVDASRALALEAVRAAARVDRDWRRAEILTELARGLKTWGSGSRDRDVAEARQAIEDAIVERALSIPAGQGRSDAIRGVAHHLDPASRHLPTLLANALDHAGFALDDAKAVVRAWAVAVGRDLDARALSGVIDVVARAPDAALRAQALGYVHLQAKKATRGNAPSTALRAGLAAATAAPEDARLDALRYLATVADDEEELKRVRDAADGLPDAEARVRLLSTLGGFADKRGLRDLGNAWLAEAARATETIEDAGPRAVTRGNVAKGFARSGRRDDARALVEAARADVESVEDPAERLRVSHRVRAAGDVAGVPIPHDWPPGVADLSSGKTTPHGAEPAPDGENRDVLVLHGAYEGGLTPAHVRAVARAAPLCDAFGLDLTLVGFPATDASAFADSVARDTNVGGSGRHVRALADAGRIRLLAPNVDWDSLADTVVATTSRPDASKALGMRKAVERAGKSGNVALVMGLGKHGLPRDVVDAAAHHLDLTGARVSFETAVAMGVMVERLRAARDAASRERDATPRD